MKLQSKGFTLIELMIVIAIIGILAAIAIPSYQTYIYKARFTELMAFAQTQTNAVAEYLTEQGATSANCNLSVINNGVSVSSPISTTGSPSGWGGTTNVLSWTISTANCAITVTGKSAQFANTTPTLVLTPAVLSDGSITWACTSTTTGTTSYAPSTCP